MSAKEPVSHINPDSATYLEGDLPRYASGGKMEIQGKTCDMNALQNPFDAGANINDDIPNPNTNPPYGDKD